MKKITVLTAISIGLLAVNIVLIWMVFARRPMPLGGEGPRNIIIEKLGFDENQSKEYDKLIAVHKSEIRKSDGQLMELKNKLYSTLISDGQKSGKDSLIMEISTIQQKIENIHYSHFQDIKKLCKPEQLKAFDALCDDLTKLFARHPKKRKNE